MKRLVVILASSVFVAAASGCVIRQPGPTAEEIRMQQEADRALEATNASRDAALQAQEASIRAQTVMERERLQAEAAASVAEEATRHRRVILYYGMSNRDLSVSSLEDDLAQSRLKRERRARGLPEESD